MKTASLILLIVGCVLVCGVAYASVANLGSQQSSGNSATDPESDRSTNAERATVSSQSRDRNATIDSDERAGRHYVSNRTRPHRLPTPSKANRHKQVQHDREHSRPEAVTRMHQQSLPKPASTTSKVVAIHTLPVRPATGAAISGQQFRNGRNRSATPIAAIGGPTSTRRSAAAINGTEVNRRHLN